MKPLHFVSGPSTSYNVRVQRFIQHSVDSGEYPVLFHEECKLIHGSQRVWVPSFDRVAEVAFKRCRRLNYLLPPKGDPVGLKKVFFEYGCDIVHAHNLFAAFYSVNLGLPTVFDDWEFHLRVLQYYPVLVNHFSNRQLLKCLAASTMVLSFPLKWLRRHRAEGIVKCLLRAVPVIVTNRYVKEVYEGLGGKAFFVPNVPLKFERDYVESRNVEKAEVTTTCYVGSFENDNARNPIRDASAVPDLWKKHDIGKLYAFEGKNWLSHLEMLCKLKSCHFNLLYWKPKPFHRFYNQNKAFLASALGVPTIIVASLVGTVNLLGEYALPVMQPEDIPLIIKSYQPKRLPVKPEHFMEYYVDSIDAAYETVCN